MKKPCPNYFVRRVAGVLPWEVVRDNQDGTRAITVAVFATKAEAVQRRAAIVRRCQARQRNAINSMRGDR